MQKNVLINSFNKGVRNFFLTELVSKPIVFKKFTPNEGKYFLDLLEIFFYYDLNKLSLTIPQVEILYKKIFSYLYSGDFGDGTDIKLYEKPNKKSKNAISKLNVNQIRENHKILKDLYSFYTRELKSLKLPSGKKISKIIVFEAPP